MTRVGLSDGPRGGYTYDVSMIMSAASEQRRGVSEPWTGRAPMHVSADEDRWRVLAGSLMLSISEWGLH